MLVGFQEIETLFTEMFASDILILLTLSGGRDSGLAPKVSIRPLIIKNKSWYQVTENYPQQAIHRNLTKEGCLEWLKKHWKAYHQTFCYTKVANYHVLVSKKGHVTLLKKSPSKEAASFVHNRQKEYLLLEGIPAPFLVELGVMNSEGKVYASKRDKFRQINRFLEMIEDILPHLDQTCPVRIIDFGCGKAYLTFALYHFLKNIRGYEVMITGLDLKQDVIERCTELAKSLGYQHDLEFIQGDINHFEQNGKVDLMVSLHACDTATDAALEKAIRWQSKVILCVPCCQHELLQQIQQEALRPLLKHGILKERFAALATDAARAQLLETLGYQTQILEFIDLEHTPKNLLIRAVRRENHKLNKNAWQTYLHFKHHLEIEPSLERRFRFELKS